MSARSGAMRRVAGGFVFAIMVWPIAVGDSHAQGASGDGISAAVITETGALGGNGRDAAGEAPVRPHWCNGTSALVDDIHKRGGESILWFELDEGRTIERYQNASEEVVIEHGADGNSCLLELRERIRR